MRRIEPLYAYKLAQRHGLSDLRCSQFVDWLRNYHESDDALVALNTFMEEANDI